jgi:hypothetical protein
MLRLSQISHRVLAAAAAIGRGDREFGYLASGRDAADLVGIVFGEPQCAAKDERSSVADIR